MEQFYKDEVEKLSPRLSDYKIFRERGIWLGEQSEIQIYWSSTGS